MEHFQPRVSDKFTPYVKYIYSKTAAASALSSAYHTRFTASKHLLFAIRIIAVYRRILRRHARVPTTSRALQNACACVLKSHTVKSRFRTLGHCYNMGARVSRQHHHHFRVIGASVRADCYYTIVRTAKLGHARPSDGSTHVSLCDSDRQRRACAQRCVIVEMGHFGVRAVFAAIECTMLETRARKSYIKHQHALQRQLAIFGHHTTLSQRNYHPLFRLMGSGNDCGSGSHAS